MIKMQLLDAERVSNRLKRAMRAVDTTTSMFLNETAERTKEVAIEGIQGGPATGNIYTYYNPYRQHQASAPGEYPAEDLGGLVASIQIDYATAANPHASVGSSIYYALDLEFGSAKYAPRPWLQPSINQATLEMKGRYFELWKIVFGSEGPVR